MQKDGEYSGPFEVTDGVLETELCYCTNTIQHHQENMSVK